METLISGQNPVLEELPVWVHVLGNGVSISTNSKGVDVHFKMLGEQSEKVPCARSELCVIPLWLAQIVWQLEVEQILRVIILNVGVSATMGVAVAVATIVKFVHLLKNKFH